MNVRTISALLASSLLMACTASESGGFAPGDDDGWSLNNPSPVADSGQDMSLLPDVGPDPVVQDTGGPDPIEPDAGGPDPIDAGGPPVDVGATDPIDSGSTDGPCATNSDCTSGTVCCAGTGGTLSCTPEADCFFDGTCAQDSECPNNGECCDFSQFGIPQNVCRPTCDMGGGGMQGGCTNNTDCATDEVCCPGLGGSPKCELKTQCVVGGLCAQDVDCRDGQTCCSFGVPNLSICNDRCSF